ncbi:hypothetical protein LRR81_12155 [Metabacillus sp. GX 13764]|nr:hypothetical protein [Metabacillus kandeliae]MCD7035002.1 hypothetical protein [Metabacillus kandeliae]
MNSPKLNPVSNQAQSNQGTTTFKKAPIKKKGCGCGKKTSAQSWNR